VRRVVGALVIVAAVGAVIVTRASATAPAPQPPAPRPPARIVLIGDSLMGEVAAAVQAAVDGTASVQHVLTIGTANVSDDWWDVWPRVLDEYDPDAIAVMVGPWEINGDDLGTPAWRAWYASRLDRWADLLAAEGADLYWLTAPPARERAVERGLAVVNHEYEQLAQRRSGITLVDSAASLGGTYREWTAGGERLRRIDGLHLCPAGEVQLATALLEAMHVRPEAEWERGAWTTHEPAYSPVECGAERVE
jgi:hypothetical protein